MSVTLEEAKNYLRVDFDEDDGLLENLIKAAESMVADVSRDSPLEEDGKIATLYAVAYLYEHREEANHNDLMLTLRALLAGKRKESF